MSIPNGCGVAPLAIDGAEVPINRYFLNHPEMVLGNWSRKDTLYGGEGYSVLGNGDLAGQLRGGHPPPAAIRSAASISGPGTARPGFHTAAAGTPHHRRQLLRRRRPHHLPIRGRARRARGLRRHDLAGRRHA